MKIALVNKYLRPKGGADVCVLQQARLLRERGHQVVLMGMPPAEGGAEEFPRYEVPSVDYHATLSAWEQAGNAGRLLYSTKCRKVMQELIRRERPDLVHYHNIYHQLSPSVIDAAAAFEIPRVMTLHDYKLTCPVYTHYREGHPCEQCRGRRFLNCLRHRCTDRSVIRSAINSVEMYLHHNILNLYGKLDACISPSRFLRDKVRELGFRGRIAHLTNFVDPDEFRPRYDWSGRRVVYFGRLSREKGLPTVLEAVRGMDVELMIIGTGPREKPLKASVARNGMENVRFMGYRTGADLRDLVAGSMFSVLPSEYYENYPCSVVESFALGIPVVGSRTGGIPELIDEARGVCFEPGDVEGLRAVIRDLLVDSDRIRRMGRNARAFVERRLGPEVHYRGLMEIYESCRPGRRVPRERT